MIIDKVVSAAVIGFLISYLINRYYQSLTAWIRTITTIVILHFLQIKDIIRGGLNLVQDVIIIGYELLKTLIEIALSAMMRICSAFIWSVKSLRILYDSSIDWIFAMVVSMATQICNFYNKANPLLLDCIQALLHTIFNFYTALLITIFWICKGIRACIECIGTIAHRLFTLVWQIVECALMIVAAFIYAIFLLIKIISRIPAYVIRILEVCFEIVTIMVQSLQYFFILGIHLTIIAIFSIVKLFIDFILWFVLGYGWREGKEVAVRKESLEEGHLFCCYQTGDVLGSSQERF